jgi:hypothetical protein
MDNDGGEYLQEFFKWMDGLNKEAMRRGYWAYPLPGEIAHGRNCWIEDFDNGLSPAEALDADARST